jgi:hypothetical protein
MLRTIERRRAIRTLHGWAISVLLEAGAVRECEEHGWMQDRADPHARERALDVPAKTRPRASLRRLPRPRSRRCSTRWETPVRSARPNRPTARLRRASHSFFKNIAEVITAEIAGRMYADSDRETPAEMPGCLLPSPQTWQPFSSYRSVTFFGAG